MDFWNEQALMTALMPGGQQPQKTAQTEKKTPEDSFQKLLDKQQSAQSAKPEAKADAPKEADAAPEGKPVKTEESQTVEVIDPKELEKQMALAAMAVMQNPVVPAAEPVEPNDPGLAYIVEPEDGEFELVPIPKEVWEKGYSVSREPLADTEQAFTVPKETDVAEELKPQEAEVPTETVEPEVEQKAVETKTASSDLEVQAESSDAEEPKEAVEAPETPVFKDVQSVPVKVGEAPKAEEAPEVPVEKQIGGKIVQAVEAGETRVELQLEPENLGRVTVEMTIRENGTLHVALHTESGRTANLLERGLDNLHMMLARNAQQDVQVEVQRQEESQRQDLYDGRQGHPQQQDQQHQRRQERRESEDFLQQLRLGLVPVDGE